MKASEKKMKRVEKFVVSWVSRGQVVYGRQHYETSSNGKRITIPTYTEPFNKLSAAVARAKELYPAKGTRRVVYQLVEVESIDPSDLKGAKRNG